jgi:hypothetical protein
LSKLYSPILEELAGRKLTDRIKIVSGINLLSLEHFSHKGGLSVPMGMDVIRKGKIVPLSDTEKD